MIISARKEYAVDLIIANRLAESHYRLFTHAIEDLCDEEHTEAVMVDTLPHYRVRR